MAEIEDKALHRSSSSEKYYPLRAHHHEVRLLTLRPGSDNSTEEQLTCDLRTVSLDSKPEYEALSYCWGDSFYRCAIRLGDSHHLVTPNLFRALLALRTIHEPRTLWVDAICINQDDLDERKQQVTIMSEIYRSASKVRVWLGTGTFQDSEGLYRLGPHIRLHANEQSTHFTDVPILGCLKFLYSDGTAWWKRAWTVQEALFARELVFHLGETTLSLTDLAMYADAINSHLGGQTACCAQLLGNHEHDRAGLTFFLQRVNALRSDRNNFLDGQFDIIDVIEKYKHRHASDLRDKIYAFVSMARDIPEDFVTYDLPLKECLIHCAKKLILGTHGINVLRYVHQTSELDSTFGGSPFLNPLRSTILTPGGGISFLSPIQQDSEVFRTRRKDLPSWCPDWSRHFSLRNAAHHDWYNIVIQRFCASPKPSSATFPSEYVLKTPGIICDTIQEIGDVPEPTDWTFPKQNMRHWHRLISTFVDSTTPCDGCNEVKWASYFRCETCHNFTYCSGCLESAGETHPNHVFETANKGPSLRRAVSVVGTTEWEGETLEIRPAVASDAVGGFDEVPDFVVEHPRWSRLAGMAYPLVEGDSVKAAFQKTLTADTRFFGEQQTIQVEELRPETNTLAAIAARLSVDLSSIETLIFNHFWHQEVESMPGFEGMEGVGVNCIEVLRSIVESVAGRRNLFISRKGYIGIGPATCKQGDIITILQGGQVPFILRKLDQQNLELGNAGMKCSLVGEAYVHGLMHGEAIHAKRAGDCHEQCFYIS